MKKGTTRIMAILAILIILGSNLLAQGTFTNIPTGTTEQLNAVWGPSPDTVFIVGNNGAFLICAGTTVIPIVSQTNENLTSISGSSAQNVWACGPNGVIIHYDGVSANLCSITSGDLNFIKVLAPNDVWACGPDGLTAHYDGTQWCVISNEFADFNFKYLCESAGNIYFSGTDPSCSKIIVYDGTIFFELRVDSADTHDWSRVSVQNYDLFYLFGETGTFMINHNSDNLIQIYPTGSRAQYVFNDNELIMAGGANTGIVTYNNGNWNILDSNSGVQGIYAPMNSKHKVYFVGTGGDLFYCDLSVGIEENKLNPKVLIYPNPATNQVTIDLKLEEADNLQMELINSLGEIIKTIDKPADTNFSINIPVADLTPGSYFIKITTDQGNNFSKKIIITR